MEGCYWSPKRVGGGAFGVEDLLTGFAVGVFAWLLAAVPGLVSSRTLHWRRRPAVWRLVGCWTGGVLGFFVLWRVGAPPMPLYIACLGAGALGMVLCRPVLWPMAVSGALGLALLWFVVVTICFLIWPDSVSGWNETSALGRLYVGVPLGELVWAAAFGGAWPMFTVFVLDARLGRVGEWEEGVTPADAARQAPSR